MPYLVRIGSGSIIATILFIPLFILVMFFLPVLIIVVLLIAAVVGVTALLASKVKRAGKKEERKKGIIDAEYKIK